MLDREVEYRRMAEAERRLWWYRSLHRMVIQTLHRAGVAPGDPLIDAGCGTGGLMAALKESHFTRVRGCDLSPDAVGRCRDQGFDVTPADVRNVAALFSPVSARALICNDVFCFLGRPEWKPVTDQFFQILQPGGIAILNLPALSAFRGIHDVAIRIGHRFSKKDLPDLFDPEKFSMVRAVYWPFLLSPLILAVRLGQRIRLILFKNVTIESDVHVPPFWLNEPFRAITDLENNCLRAKPWGSSLFVVLRKSSPVSR